MMVFTLSNLVLMLVLALFVGVAFGITMMAILVVSRKSDLESMLAEEKKKVRSLVTIIDETCWDIRDRHEDDSVCGLCEYDGPEWAECPGYETSECFMLKKSFIKKYLEE